MSKSNVTDKSLLQKLLEAKGYEKLETKNDKFYSIYMQIDTEAECICIVSASEGAMFFKEFIISTDMLDALMAIVHVGGEVKELDESKGSRMAKTLVENEGYKLVYRYSKQKSEKINVTNEGLVRAIEDDGVISIIQVRYVNGILADISELNISYEDMIAVCERLKKEVEKMTNKEE